MLCTFLRQVANRYGTGFRASWLASPPGCPRCEMLGIFLCSIIAVLYFTPGLPATVFRIGKDLWYNRTIVDLEHSPGG